MFSLIHYFPRASFTGIFLPNTHFLLHELKTNKNSSGEVLYINNYVAYLRRKNKYTWEGQSFINNFNITSIIQKKDGPSLIREQIEITIKNHIEFDINLDYSLELLDDLHGVPKSIIVMNNYKYLPKFGKIETPNLKDNYTTDILEKYTTILNDINK
jgi:hypothetical protein